MKAFVSFCLVFTTLNLTASTNETKSVEDVQALKLIEEFKGAPLSEEGRVAASKIVKFAEASEDISINVTSSLLPWLAGKTSERSKGLLTGAYIAGNTESQLRSKRKSDDPHAGIVLVLSVYQKLKLEDSKLTIPKLEEFIVLESQGKLKAHLNELLQAESQKEQDSSRSQSSKTNTSNESH